MKCSFLCAKRQPSCSIFKWKAFSISWKFQRDFDPQGKRTILLDFFFHVMRWLLSSNLTMQSSFTSSSPCCHERHIVLSRWRSLWNFRYKVSYPLFFYVALPALSSLLKLQKILPAFCITIYEQRFHLSSFHSSGKKHLFLLHLFDLTRFMQKRDVTFANVHNQRKNSIRSQQVLNSSISLNV